MREREAAALDFFEKREREVAESYGRLTEAWYTSVPPGTIEKLKAAPQLTLRQAKAVEPRPAIQGNLIVLGDEIANVNARRLVETAVQQLACFGAAALLTCDNCRHYRRPPMSCARSPKHSAPPKRTCCLGSRLASRCCAS